MQATAPGATAPVAGTGPATLPPRLAYAARVQRRTPYGALLGALPSMPLSAARNAVTQALTAGTISPGQAGNLWLYAAQYCQGN